MSIVLHILVNAAQALASLVIGASNKEEVSEDEIDLFVRAARPSSPQKSEATALLVADSHQKCLLPDVLEKGLECKVIHGIAPSTTATASGGHPLRCYNSTRMWRNGRFREGSQDIRVPLLLREGFFTFLIISLCCSDVTNIRGLEFELQLWLADESAKNSLATAEEAVRKFEMLQVRHQISAIFIIQIFSPI